MQLSGREHKEMGYHREQSSVSSRDYATRVRKDSFVLAGISIVASSLLPANLAEALLPPMIDPRWRNRAPEVGLRTSTPACRGSKQLVSLPFKFSTPPLRYGQTRASAVPHGTYELTR